ncbi:MAG: hypothetical protein COA99_00265 [Moraxellaceae bacterium]|nr:MAG: hypothetical protein COA99_00265 [Moraxellaceae bacterium]
MKRLLAMLSVVCVCFISVSSASALAFERYVAGVHYKIVAPAPSKTATPHVAGFFSYACPHCDHLEPELEKWRQGLPPGVQFQRVPALWNPTFKAMAKLYYALESMQLAEKHGQAIFEVIHRKKRSLLGDEQSALFLQSLGVDKEKLLQALNSDVVKVKMREAKGLLAKYRIAGVPGFVVNGRYFIDNRLAGSTEALFEIINFLLKK